MLLPHQSPDSDDVVDVVIVGAGLYGISAARTYLEVYPDIKLLIVEGSSYIGGVWSSERIYDGFWTQTVVGMAEFSDSPLKAPPESEQYYGFFPAKYVTSYLEEYVDNHVYNEQTIRSRILFDTRVESISRVDKSWAVHCKGRRILSTRKLIIATGLTSNPNIPNLRNQADFGRPIIHQKELGTSSLLTNPNIIRVTVLGGGKSAADIAYAAAKAGKQVSWNIRKTGSGAAAHATAKGNAVYRNANDMLYNRLSSYLSPSIFLRDDWLVSFLHRTRAGRLLVKRIWGTLDQKYRQNANYDRDGARHTGFNLLTPDTELFWQNDSTGVNQKADFWDTIATSVQVYRADIDRLEPGCIHLFDGQIIQSDGIICATGWKDSLQFFSQSIASELGLPCEHPEVKERWNLLEKDADCEILNQFPLLANSSTNAIPEKTSPFRLYKHIAPLSDDGTLAFVGHIAVGNAFRAAEVQALWAVAYLSDTMPTKGDREKEVARQVAWCRRRYPYRGLQGLWLYYDLIPYTDDLLNDIGLKSHTGRGWKHVVKVCRAHDLKDLVEEYKAMGN